MAAPPSFPSLVGQGWSVHKKPSFSTRVASHVSGREARTPFYSYPLYEFELTFEGLDSAGGFQGLTANGLQSLMGLYLQCQGQYGTFLYTDPTDNAVAGQAIGTGDGTTTSFTAQRTLGGFTEPASWAASVSNVYFNGNLVSGWTLSQPNSIVFASAPLAPPTTVYKLSETAAAGQHYTTQSLGSQSAGTNVTVSLFAKAAEDSALLLELYNGSASPFIQVDLSTGSLQAAGAVTASSVIPVGGGWYFVSLTCTMAATATASVFILPERPYLTYSFAGIAGNGILFCGANLQIGTAAPTALPAFSTVSNATVATNAAAPPAGASAITADFSYAFQCRFLDDQNDFENFMQGLWKIESLKFRSVKP